MEESIATYAARSVLIKLTGAMAEVAKVLCENIKLIEKLNQDIAACDLRDARLRGLMYTPKVRRNLPPYLGGGGDNFSQMVNGNPNIVHA